MDEYHELTAAKTDNKGSPSVSQGMSVMKTTLFIVGETAGTGILALPHAMEATGYSGLVLTIGGGLVSMYTTVLLGRCWLMIRNSNSEYKGHVRHPYAVIGQLAFGTPGRLAVSTCGNLHLFSCTVVFLVVGSQNIQNLLENIFDIHVSFCYLELILTAILLPLTWLGSPKDMWFVGNCAGLTILLAVVLLMYILITDALRLDSLGEVQHNTPDLLGAIQAIGIINFAFGGHSGYPVMQCDMEDPSKWNIASRGAFLVMITMYTSVGFGGYLVYGAKVKGNVLLSASPGPVLYTVQILITIHLLCGFVTIINPVVLELEELLQMRKEFSLKRVASRSVLVLLSLFLAETIPRFESLAALVGALGATSLAFVGPPLLYLRLRRSNLYSSYRSVPLHVQTVMLEIAIVGAVLGLVAAYSAIVSLYNPGSLTVPCYVNTQSASP